MLKTWNCILVEIKLDCEACMYIDMGLETARNIAYLEGERRAYECLGSFHFSLGLLLLFKPKYRLLSSRKILL